MSTVVVRSKGQLTIPADVREATHLEEGDPVEVVVVAEGILLRPQKVIDATQAWYWSAGWQAGEREALADYTAGRSTVFDSSEDFLASLDD